MDASIKPENYGSQNLVSLWREFINWDKRRAGEGDFLIRQLHSHNAKKVFDASLGDGCDSIFLLKQGFEVTSNEIDKAFLDKAWENARLEKVDLTVTTIDWRNLDLKMRDESYDAAILLGNSLTYLFNEADQLEALRQLKRILRPGGVLILDERNYQYILDNREKILRGDFRYSGRYVYCGDKVHGIPVEISDHCVKMEYSSDLTGVKGHLAFYPFKRGEVKRLLEKTGFNTIEQYQDYATVSNKEPDFYQYVCVR